MRRLAAEEEGCFSSLIRNHCMSRGSNEIAAIKMMPVYMPRVLGSREGREYKASSGFVHRRGTRYVALHVASSLSLFVFLFPLVPFN